MDLFEPGSGFTHQLHDFNPGIAPSGLFWTIRIPDHALTVRGQTVHLRLVDQPVIDSHVFGSPDAVPSRVSVDMTWEATGPPIVYAPGSTDPTDPSSFAAEFRPAVATGCFSGCSAEGFRFHGTASSEGVFAEMGHERNGVFLNDGHKAKSDVMEPAAADLDEAPMVPIETVRALPNPARTGVDVEFTPRESGPVEIQVFDLAGRLVSTLADRGPSGPGAHRAHWDLRDAAGTRVAAGVYLVRIHGAATIETHRLIVLE